MSKIGVVAGSFDPITAGHVWLIGKAAELVGEGGKLHVTMAVNPAKKYYFDAETRISLIQTTLENWLPTALFNRIVVDVIDNDLLINHARRISATHIFRGIRNAVDFNYEADIQQVNLKICSNIDTVFFIPPPDMSSISSSTVKGLVGFDGWENVVEEYIHKSVITAFKEKLKCCQ